MADVDQNNRQAQKWPELETKRLESAQASAKVDSKQRGLFDALSDVVKFGLKDLYGDADDPKYLYIVNLVMARVRAAISEKLVDFGTDEVQNLTKLLDAKLAEQTKEQYESLSQTFTDVVQTAFSDLTVKVDADDKIGLLDSVREYVESAVRTIRENKPTDEIASKLDEVKDKLLKSFGSNNAETGKSKSDLKASFRAKTQNLIQQQLTILASNQKRLQTNMSVNFKKTGVLVDRNVDKLDTTINSSMNTISGKLSLLGKSIKSLSLGSIMSSVGSGLMSLLSGPFGMITGALSKLWSGVCGLTKWAAGGLFSIIGKFFKSPAGLFAIGYMIWYAYTKWIKPWWDNIAKTEIGKWLDGEQGFLDMLKNTVMRTLGMDPSKGGFFEQLFNMISTVEICKFDDNGVMGTITDAINKAGKLVGIKAPSTSGSFTIGTALIAIGGLVAASIAASIAGNPALASIAVIAASVAAMKNMIDKILKKFGIDTGVQTTTAAHSAGAALHVATAPIRNANSLIKTEAKVAKAAQKVTETTKVLDKTDDAIKAAQNAVKTADTAKDAAKASTQLANAQKKGNVALKNAIKAEESLEKTLVKLGIKQNKVSGFTKWLSKFPKVMKALKFLGPVGILASAGASIFELFEAYEACQKDQTGMAALKTTKAVNAIAGLATGPAGMAVATAMDLVLDHAVEWQSAVYDVENTEKDSVKLQQKLDASQKALAQKQLAKLSPEQVLQKQLADYDKVKKEYDRLAAEEKKYNDELANMGWWDKHMTKADAVARSNAENYRSRKNALLMKYGFKDEAALKGFEHRKLDFDRQPPKLDFETSQAAQKTIDDLRSQAQQTPDMSDDEFVEKIQEGFNNGNAQVIEMLKTIMMNQQNQKPSINTVMGISQPYNPAMADTYGPAMHAGLNR